MKISEITHEKENSQLYPDADGVHALIDYKIRKDSLYLTLSETS